MEHKRQKEGEAHEISCASVFLWRENGQNKRAGKQIASLLGGVVGLKKLFFDYFA
nr:hypothetical protein [uncultured Butyricicoccus sp.]